MWIKLHDALPDHPKVLAAAAALGIDKDLLVGKLARLWLWAATGRENGFIADYEADTVAEVMRWKKNPKALLEALSTAPPRYTAGLLDRVEGGYCIHGWDEQIAELVDGREVQREKTRQRVARYRERKSAGDVTRYTALQDSVTVTACNAPKIEKNRATKKREEKSSCGGNAREDWNPFGDAPERPPDTIEAYLTDNLSPLSPGNIEELNAFQEAGMQPDAIRYAVDQAAAQGKSNWAYVRGILRRMEQAGIFTAGAAKAAEDERTRAALKARAPTRDDRADFFARRAKELEHDES